MNETYLLVWHDKYLVRMNEAVDASDLPSLDGITVDDNTGELVVDGVELRADRSLRYIRNCSSATDNIDLEDPRVISSLVPLGIICLVVIFGNIMVIAAVRMTRKMRGATNLFIVSLAWADLTLGIVVLPFSAMFEVFGVWIFGRIWCSIWLAVDVWTCTASILHLVVISLDRYIAVTHPITYPNIMTSKRAKMLILGAWVLSFVICFPPLVGWKEENEIDHTAMDNTTDIKFALDQDETNQIVRETMERCFPKCELIQEPGYVIYSAVGSFYAPMLVMIFFNWRIFRTATKTTKAIRQGWTKVKGVGNESIGMGIHRGGGASSSAAMSSAMMAAAAGVAGGSVNCRGDSLSTNSSSKKSSSLLSASVRHHYPGSGVNARRKLSASLGVSQSTGTSGIRRNKTLTATSSSNSRTLPTKMNISNGSAVATNNRRKNCGAADVTSSKDDALVSVPLLNGSSPRRRGSASLNSLAVPETTTTKFEGNQRSRSAQGVHYHHHNHHPHVSHHQPCPNHIIGKTFAEQGTQTYKEDKQVVSVELSSGSHSTCSVSGGKKGSTRFRWRSRSVPPKRPVSPCSITQNSESRKCTGCFNCCAPIRRWYHGRRQKCQKQQRQQKKKQRKNSIGDEDSDEIVEASAATSRLGVSNLSTGTSARPLSSSNNSSLNVGSVHHSQSHKLGKRNIKSQVRRFRMETKAAKTLGIIVGCFICCWFPFFTTYLITAFCEDCIPHLAFSIIFWLGYCNSAINPFIYAMFSRDFRNAFKKILCKFLCNKNAANQGRQTGALARMGLPFAPHTVAIGGLADRFPPTTMVTNAAGVVVAANADGDEDERSGYANDTSTSGQRRYPYP